MDAFYDFRRKDLIYGRRPFFRRMKSWLDSSMLRKNLAPVYTLTATCPACGNIVAIIQGRDSFDMQREMDEYFYGDVECPACDYEFKGP